MLPVKHACQPVRQQNALAKSWIVGNHHARWL